MDFTRWHYSGDEHPFLFHLFHKCGRHQLLIIRILEISAGVVDSAAESRSDSQQSAAQGRNNILPGSSRNNGIVRPETAGP